MRSGSYQGSFVSVFARQFRYFLRASREKSDFDFRPRTEPEGTTTTADRRVTRASCTPRPNRLRAEARGRALSGLRKSSETDSLTLLLTLNQTHSGLSAQIDATLRHA